MQNLDKIEQSSPKEHHVTISLSVSVPLSLTENKPISHAQSKMTTMISLELSTGREHCQTNACTEEGLFPEGGPDVMT